MNRHRIRYLGVLPITLVVFGCVEPDAGPKPGDAAGVGSTSSAPDDGGTTGQGGAGTGSASGPADGTTGADPGSGDTTGSPPADTGGADDPPKDSDGTTSGGKTTGDTTGGTTTAESSTGEEVAPSFADAVWPIFDEECGCHQDSNGAGKLKLTKKDAFDNMVGVPSNQLPSMNLVEPGSPMDSYLWHKLNNTQKSVDGKGKRMPPGGLLDADVLAGIEQWILAGAEP